MEIDIDEKGCAKLSQDLLVRMRRMAELISEIENRNNLLKSALGEDSETIARTVRTMAAGLTDAEHELSTVIDDMNEYMGRVHQARIVLTK